MRIQDGRIQAPTRRTSLAAAGLALAATATLAHPAAATAETTGPSVRQVALVDQTGEQLPFKSATSSTGQTTSYDGQLVVFSTPAPLVKADDNELDDVYLRNLTTGRTTLVSTVDGTLGNDYSNEPTISADGRYVAFTTWADNLTAEDANGHTLDVVVKDLQEGTIELVSVTTAGFQREANSFYPVISDDGRSVAFQTFGSFGPRDDDRREDVYVRDLDRGVTRQGSLLPRNDRDIRLSVGNGDLSADGSVVVFGTNNFLWARNLETGRTTRFWHEPDSPPCQPFPAGSAGRPAISADGRFAAFASCAVDLPGEDGESTDVYRVNLATGKIVRVHPEGDGHSYLPSLSSDGRYVGFGSDASNFVEGDDHTADAFVADMRTGTLVRASQAADGTGGNRSSGGNDIAISGDGHTLVFVSYADNLVPGDTSDLREVFAASLYRA